MSELLSFALLGLGAAGIYTLLAQGIVVIYRGSGILNFALGAYAMAGSYLFVELRTEYRLSVTVAILISVAAIAVLGALTYQIVMRPLRRAAPISRVIATLGVMLVITAVATLRFGSAPKPYLKKILPSEPVEVLGTTLSSDRLWLFGIGVAATVVLWLVYSKTTFGLATTASAENPLAAATFGWSPVTIATTNWAIGSALAGLAGILVIPIFAGLEITRLTLVVIYALAVAVIGAFRSFPLVLVGGVLVGMTESIVSRYVDGTVQGSSATVPLLIIVVYLVFRGRSMPDRSVVLENLPRLGSGRIRPVPLVGSVVLTIVVMLAVLPDNWNVALTASLAAATVMLSLVVLTGYAGQLSLGQYAIAGFGALVAARLVHDLGFPFELAFLAGVLGAVPLGLLFALPALRTRGINLAVVTLALGLAVQNILFNNVDYSGGADGIELGPQTVFGISIDPVLHPGRYAALALISFACAAIAVTNLRRSRSGRRLIAVRTNERAAASLGIDIVGAKLYAFAVSSAIAGLGGVIFAFQAYSVVFLSFTPMQSILAVTFVVIGGLGFVAGPLYGSILVAGGLGGLFGDEIVHALGFDPNETVQFLALIGGLSVIAILIQAPDGLARANAELAKHLVVLAGRRKAATTDTTTAEVAIDDHLDRVRPAVLAVRDLTVRFGGVVAVSDVSFDVKPGEVVGLIGPNGAGKTTVIDAITGFVAHSGGRIELDDRSIGDSLAHKRARAGISRSFQSLELFEDITVLENLLAASDKRDARSYVTDLVHPGKAVLTAETGAAVREFKLGDVLDLRPDELPYGRRRLVAIARTVATAPSVLLLDEPAAGLDEDESAELAHLVRRLADEWGMGILLVEHDMAFVMGVCDRVVVLEFGQKISDGKPAEVRSDPAVIAAYLGSEDSDTDLDPPPKTLATNGAGKESTS